jgi:hypothetical protein
VQGSGGTYEFRTTKSFEVRQRSGVKPEIISVDGIKNHPNALAAQTGKACGACHQNPAGGGPRNAFGEAFAANGHKLPEKK